MSANAGARLEASHVAGDDPIRVDAQQLSDLLEIPAQIDGSREGVEIVFLDEPRVHERDLGRLIDLVDRHAARLSKPSDGRPGTLLCLGQDVVYTLVATDDRVRLALGAGYGVR